MQALSTYGRRAAALMAGARTHAPSAVDGALEVAETFGGGVLAGWLSSKHVIKGGDGRIAKLPIPLGLGLVLGVGALVSRSHTLMNVAKGSLAAQGAIMGIKMAYKPTGQPPMITGVPGPMYGGYIPTRVGAVPNVEAAFRQAGLMPA